VVKSELLDRASEAINAIRDGKSPTVQPRETLLVCNSCDDPLQVIAAANGSYKYVCRRCIGAKA